MAENWVLCSFVVLFLIWKINCQDLPPVVEGSYKVVGELVERLQDGSNILTQIAFEESYDAETKNAAFVIWIMGRRVGYIENYDTNQTFRYNETDCQLISLSQWMKDLPPPSLMGYEDTNGTVRFSLKQLLAFDQSHLKEWNVSTIFRGIPARKWMYEIKEAEDAAGVQTILTMYAYWSDPFWNTTSNKASVPLGFVVSKIIHDETEEKKVIIHHQYINVFSFVPNTIDHKLFEPIEGRQCENRAQTLLFVPVDNLQALSFRSELLIPEYLEIKYVDTWLDTRNKLIRLDMERTKQEIPIRGSESRMYQSETVIGQMGVVFRLSYHKDMHACKVIPFKDYEFDIQNLLNFKLPLTDWKIGKAFGLNETTYVYIGKTSKRDIPCHMYQGIRKDWPDPDAKVTSIWEWCFSFMISDTDEATMFKNNEYVLIHAQIKIIESGNLGDYAPGSQLTHHFYDVNVKDPDTMDATTFDISNCFSERQKRYLQFQVDWKINDDNLQLVENATSDVDFLKKWKSAIYTYSRLQPYSLRVSKVQAVLVDKKLFVKFVILVAHPDLPDDVQKTQLGSFAAQGILRTNINDKKVFISHIPSKGAEALQLYAIPHTFDFQISDKFYPHNISAITEGPSTTQQTFPFSLITEPDVSSSTDPKPDVSSSTDPKPDVSSSTDPKSGVSSSTEGDTTLSSKLPDVEKSSSSTSSSSIATSPTTPTTNEHHTSPSSTKPRLTSAYTTTNPSRSSSAPTKWTLSTKYAGHAPGTVASVSVAMLLVGISIGSAGIFIKFNGLPACLKSQT